MKIVLTGGGTGGHFFPVIAVAQAIAERVRERKILAPKLYFMSDTPYNARTLLENQIEFRRVPAGKIRRYFSLLNFFDLFKTAWGIVVAIVKMFMIYPDVVFGKGGYSSFPALVAARLLRIPVVIHESDSKPGRVNAWAGKFATKIAVSYPEAAEYFPKAKAQDRVAFTGNPIRSEIMMPTNNGAYDYLHLEPGVPVILVLGGSLGAQNVNDVIIDAVPDLINRYQIIHQVGKANLAEVEATTAIALKNHQYASRYHPLDFLNDLSLRMAAGVADLVISRAGSTIFEIAAWGLPSIIVPLPTSVSHDQTSNALAYAKTGAASVIEENNLTAHVLMAEIERIHSNPSIHETMKRQAKAFSRLDSATIIADGLLDIGLQHER